MEAFKYGCVVSGDNFCPRPGLALQLASLVASGKNIVIQGERRIGKTSLVQAAIGGMRGWNAITADFMGVKSVSDVCSRLVDAMSRHESSASSFRRLMSLLTHLRPVGTIDATTGMPTVTIDVRTSSAPSSVSTTLDALANLVRGHKTCVVFDEFQDILDIKDGDQLLALMRGRIQYLADTSFVFLGSARNEMMSIFMSPKSPFYKSAATFVVDPIPDADFFKFAERRFSLGDRILTRETFNMILDVVSRTSGDVQELCDAIWQASESGSVLDASYVERGLSIVFDREGSAYATFIKPLTDIQMRVLCALARLGGEHTLSGAFLTASCVSNPTSVKRSLSALEKAELAYSIGGEWKFVSPFFREWLKRRYQRILEW